ncbi:MAG TPA: hypothetical protein PK858_08535, partial [Saprospiraceae bacterium]|nr:hypothetical protein [Saprospiraceae bacterium]
HILEEVTFRNNGSGSYKMLIDMSEVKGMMDMMKGMANDSTGAAEGLGGAGAGEGDMSEMGKGLSDAANSLNKVQGITNVKQTNDTTNFQFGYTFDFSDIGALNRALKAINKEKYQSESGDVFRFTGKSFERLGAGDIGEEMKKAMAKGNDEAGEDTDMAMDMVKNFFGDMSYKQIYLFPDRAIKKQNNTLGEISEDKHTLTITLKPFDEEQQKKKMSVATAAKLK